MSNSLESLIARAERLLVRLEAVLPHAAEPPDWTASVAFRYRRRGSVGVLEPVKHVGGIRLSDLKEIDGPERAPGALTRRSSSPGAAPTTCC